MNVLCLLSLLSLTAAVPAPLQVVQQGQGPAETVEAGREAAYHVVQHAIKTAIESGASNVLFVAGIHHATHLIATELQEQAAVIVTNQIHSAAQDMIAAGFKEATKIAARAAAKELVIHQYIIPNVEEFLVEQVKAYLTTAVVQAAASYVEQLVVEQLVTQIMKQMVVERVLKAAALAVIEATLKHIIVEAAKEVAREVVKAHVIENAMQQAMTALFFNNLLEGCTAVVEAPVAARMTLRDSVDYWYEYFNQLWHKGVSWHGPAAAAL